MPDFQAKLEQFGSTEVALHRFRKSRYKPKTLLILTKAMQAAARSAISAKERPAKVANAAMHKAARQVAAENKRLGLPLIAIKATP